MNYRYKKYQLFRKRLPVPKEVLTRIYNGKATIQDFLDYHLEDKIPVSCLSYEYFKVVNIIGIHKALLLDWKCIFASNNIGIFMDDYYEQIANIKSSSNSADDFNHLLYKFIKDNIYSVPNDFNFEKLGQSFVEKNPIVNYISDFYKIKSIWRQRLSLFEYFNEYDQYSNVPISIIREGLFDDTEKQVFDCLELDKNLDKYDENLAKVCNFLREMILSKDSRWSSMEDLRRGKKISPKQYQYLSFVIRGDFERELFYWSFQDIQQYFNEKGINDTIYPHLLEVGAYSILNKLDKDIIKKQLTLPQQHYLSFLTKNEYGKSLVGLNLQEIEYWFDNNGIKSELFEILFKLGGYPIYKRGKTKIDITKLDISKFSLLADLLNKFSFSNSDQVQALGDFLFSNLDKLDDILSKFSLLIDLLNRIFLSNSSEIQHFGSSLFKNLSNLNDFNKIEEVFLRNNLPMVGKIYLCFEYLYPTLDDFDFSEESMLSPLLKNKSIRGRRTVIFSDLLRASLGSNNRSIREYLENIEIGNYLFQQVSSNLINFEDLSSKEKNILSVFCSHLNTLYYNTQNGKNQKEEMKLSGNTIEDINRLFQLFSKNGTEYSDLPDRIISMFCHFAGFDTFNEVKQYFIQKSIQADLRNRTLANNDITLEKGDFVKGITDIKYLSNIFQNGSVAKEFLGDSSCSDSTPLDTDLSLILEKKASLESTINNTEASGYGDIIIVLKRDDRFVITRRSPQEENQVIDSSPSIGKMEAFYTGMTGEGHYGIRTGFASSEFNYIITKVNDPRVGLEVAMNGFYIPIVDMKTEKLIFTPQDYDKLREKMSGLSYYGLNEYHFSDYLITPEIEEIAKQLRFNEQDVQRKKEAIHLVIKEALSSIGLELKTVVDGDLTPGSVELIDTGSTGRGTNILGDGDFDFMMRVDKQILMNPNQLHKLKETLLTALHLDEKSIISTGDLRAKQVSVTGVDELVDIDISFVQKTNKVNYSTDESLKDRLETIKKQDPRKYDLVISNIILAKKILKEANVYKRERTDSEQGGLGGVGIENWILQHGGSLEEAAKSFMECANHKSFDEFKKDYFVWDFGENHMAYKQNTYSHDNFVSCNMSESGYQKMKAVLKSYLDNLEIQNRKNLFNTDMMLTQIKNNTCDDIDNHVKIRGYSGIELLGFVASISSIIIAIFGILFLIFTR